MANFFLMKFENVCALFGTEKHLRNIPHSSVKNKISQKRDILRKN